MRRSLVMRVLACGGLEYRDYQFITKAMDHLNAIHNFSILIHGDSGRVGPRGNPIAGADMLSGRWANEKGVQQIKVPANWNGPSKQPGMARNQFMLEMFRPNLCVAFPGGRGTANMIRISRLFGIPVIATEDIDFGGKYSGSSTG